MPDAPIVERARWAQDGQHMLRHMSHTATQRRAIHRCAASDLLFWCVHVGAAPCGEAVSPSAQHNTPRRAAHHTQSMSTLLPHCASHHHQRYPSTTMLICISSAFRDSKCGHAVWSGRVGIGRYTSKLLFSEDDAFVLSREHGYAYPDASGALSTTLTTGPESEASQSSSC